jgi:hypothetical protein
MIRIVTSASKWHTGILSAAALLVSAVSLKLFVIPYLWICLSWLIVCLFSLYRFESDIARALALNAGVALVVLSGFEVYFSYVTAGRDGLRGESRNSEGQLIRRTRPHDVLGWVPTEERLVHWKRYYEDEPIFDVTYEIDEYGLRASNAQPSTNSSECALFFGGSFTFGAGLNDSETMPYLVSSMSSSGLRTYNFGLSGYGAHQMLAALEHGIVDEVLNCEPRYVIYQGTMDHIRRVANKTTWTNDTGPRYVLDENGILTYSGQFVTPTIPNMIFRQLRKSYIVRAIMILRVTHRDIERFVAVIDASRDWFEVRYPDSKFHVLLWTDPDDVNSEEVVTQLLDKEMNVHLVSKIIPDLRSDRLKYAISVHDLHPNKLANMKIAEYVSSEIIDP